MSAPFPIRLKQLESGELVDFVSSVASGGYVPYVNALSGNLLSQFGNLFVGSETGVVTASNTAIPSGAQYLHVRYNSPFYRVPSLGGVVSCPSGQPGISWNPVSETSSGVIVQFSNTINTTGYSFELLAIDTLVLTSGLASLLSASAAGIDLLTAPSAALQRQILNVQVLTEKNAANGYAGLDENGKLNTGQIPNYYSADGGSIDGTGATSAYIIQFRRGRRDLLFDYILASGEPGWAHDTKRLYIGDGRTEGGLDILSGVQFLSGKNLANGYPGLNAAGCITTASQITGFQLSGLRNVANGYVGLNNSGYVDSQFISGIDGGSFV